MAQRSSDVENHRMYEVKLSDGIITLSPLRPDDSEAHLAGEDETLVRWLSGGPGTREGVEAYMRHCQEQWDTAGPLRAFGIRVGDDETLVDSLIPNPAPFFARVVCSRRYTTPVPSSRAEAGGALQRRRPHG
jgi:hypothetical protein